MLTLGVVDGSESLSLPFSLVITSLVTASYSSDIHATFVKIISDFVFAFATTSASICIVSESKFVPVNSIKLFVPDVWNSILFVVSLYVTVYSFPFVDVTLLPVVNFDFNPVGNWSTIFVALPAFSPSLYTVRL